MTIAHSLATLPSFLMYFGAAIALVALFCVVYVKFTPYNEWTLIGQGNVAAAISLSGAVLGFAMPLASVIAHSVSWGDMLVWGLVALIVQLAVYVVARTVAPSLVADIEGGKPATGVVLAVASITVGLLNAACITW
jgi:putative membrane protein